MPQVTALVREPTPSFVQALSTHPEKGSLDFDRALEQHRQYTRALAEAGASLVFLDPLEDCPDGPFVEDTAVIFPNRAAMCPMKEKSRQGEAGSVENEVKKHRSLEILPKSATLDGGDVLDTGEILFVGLSRRTNREAVEALSRLAGKPAVPVRVLRGLHLKSSVSFLGSNLLLIDPAAVETSRLKDFEWIEVDETERYAANCLVLGSTVLMAKGYPGLARKIRDHGFDLMELEMSEFEKADGGITCLSLIIPHREPNP